MMLSIDTTPWMEWFNHIQEGVKQMDELMQSKYAVTVRETTTPFVPLETGRLIGSFITDLQGTYPLTEVMLGYSAYDPRDGFNYAEYQHDVIRTEQHPIQGVQYYLEVGLSHSEDLVFTEMEEDYLSCFHI